MIDPAVAEEQKPPVSARLAVAAGRARPCECDRPMVFRDEDLGLICGRCGHEPATGGARAPRAPRALVAVAAGVPAERPAPLRRAEPRAGTQNARVIALVDELGCVTADEVSERLGIQRRRAGVVLAHLCLEGRLARAGRCRSPRGGPPLTIFALPEGPA